MCVCVYIGVHQTVRTPHYSTPKYEIQNAAVFLLLHQLVAVAVTAIPRTTTAAAPAVVHANKLGMGAGVPDHHRGQVRAR